MSTTRAAATVARGSLPGAHPLAGLGTWQLTGDDACDGACDGVRAARARGQSPG